MLHPIRETGFGVAHSLLSFHLRDKSTTAFRSIFLRAGMQQPATAAAFFGRRDEHMHISHGRIAATTTFKTKKRSNRHGT